MEILRKVESTFTRTERMFDETLMVLYRRGLNSLPDQELLSRRKAYLQRVDRMDHIGEHFRDLTLTTTLLMLSFSVGTESHWLLPIPLVMNVVGLHIELKRRDLNLNLEAVHRTITDREANSKELTRV